MISQLPNFKIQKRRKEKI